MTMKQGPQPARDQARSERLLAALEKCRHGSNDPLDQDYPSYRAAVHARLHDALPLHGTKSKLLDEIWKSGALLSRSRIDRSPLRHQPCFGTHDAVYASVGVMHPAREVAVAFSPRIESDSSRRIEASPWDTGMFYIRACERLGLDTEVKRRRAFDEHCLPAPLYRDFFVDYVATCFSSPEDYPRSAPVRRADPAGVMNTQADEALLRVFELRVYSELPLRLAHVEAVFLHSAARLSKTQREDMLPKLRQAGVAVDYYGKGPKRGGKANASADDLRTYVTQWVCKRQPTLRPV